MRVSFRLALVIVGACLWLSPPSSALAQPSTAARAIATGQEALALFQQGRHEEALAKFREAEAFYHSPVFLLYEGRSLREIGRWVEALATLRRVAEESLEGAPPPWKQAQADAQRERAALEAEIPSAIVILDGGSASTHVTIDGTAIAVGERIELDPGPHRIVATEGDRTASQNATLSARVHGLRVVVALPPAAAPEVPKSSSPILSGAKTKSKSGLYVPGLVVAGTGAAALVAGGVVGVLALSRAGAARRGLPETCDGLTCSTSRMAEIDPTVAEPRRLGTVADVLLVTGGVAVVVGVYLLIVHPGAPPDGAAGVSSHRGSLVLHF